MLRAIAIKNQNNYYYCFGAQREGAFINKYRMTSHADMKSCVLRIKCKKTLKKKRKNLDIFNEQRSDVSILY